MSQKISEEKALNIIHGILRDLGVNGVDVRFSTYQPGGGEWSDATMLVRGKSVLINLKPELLQSWDESYIREILIHEIEHLVKDERW